MDIKRITSTLLGFPLVDKYDWKEIKCVENDQIKTIDQIHEEIWKEIKKYI